MFRNFGGPAVASLASWARMGRRDAAKSAGRRAAKTSRPLRKRFCFVWAFRRAFTRDPPARADLLVGTHPLVGLNQKTPRCGRLCVPQEAEWMGTYAKAKAKAAR